MSTHELKIWPEYFLALTQGQKRAELRKNDRPFGVGDLIKFREYDPKTQQYTKRSAIAKIIHIAQGEPIPADYVLLSIAPPLAPVS